MGCWATRTIPKCPTTPSAATATSCASTTRIWPSPPDSGKNKSLEIEGAVEVTLDYRLFMPNTILLDQYIESVDQRYLLFFSVCPTGRKTCRCFTFMGRD